jgi:pimeloyl-ACP methyl ester carboxylesterase
MTKASKRNSAQAPGQAQQPLLQWGAGAAGVAVVAGAVAFNAVRARQAERANPPLGSFLDADGVRLHYLEKGTGPLIVLLHGNATSLEDWLASGVFDALAETNRVIAFDRPGFGHSSRPRSVIWTPAAQARLIARALAEKGEGPATVVGHSFGTLVASELALGHPAHVQSLVLIGGYFYPSARLDAVLGSPPAIPVVGDIIRYTVSPLLGAAMQKSMEKQMFAPAPISAGWKDRFPFEMSLRPSQIRASAGDAALMVPAAASFQKRLGDLDRPVTIIAGAGDKVVTTSGQSARLARELPGSTLLIVENAGHMVHHTAHQRVAAAITVAAAR